MDLCEQCRSYSATHIDDEAALWCGRCAERRVEGEQGLPYLWEIAERRHFLTQVYPTLRYSTFIQDKRNPLWAKKLGVSFVPPGQRAVDQDDPPAAPPPQGDVIRVQQGDVIQVTWTVHVSEDGMVETWMPGPAASEQVQEQRLGEMRAALETWKQAHQTLGTYQRTKELLRNAQAAIADRKRA